MTTYPRPVNRIIDTAALIAWRNWQWCEFMVRQASYRSIRKGLAQLERRSKQR